MWSTTREGISSASSAQDEHRANVCAALVMATVFTHGATHLLLGEDSNVLTDPYYPRNHRIDPESLGLFVRYTTSTCAA